VLVGRATWYGPGFHGRRTASGERFNRHALTLASRGLPMQTMVRITNLKNGRAAVARVNDRGPYAHGAIVDLSEALARRVGMGGTSRVKVEVLGWKGQY
jgi:rare lipoprotein A